MNPILTTTVAVVTISIFATLGCRNVTNPKVETPAEKAFRELPNIIERSPIEKVAELRNCHTATDARPISGAGCKDCVYEFQSPVDGYKYVHIIKLKAKNGLISRVSFNKQNLGLGNCKKMAYCQQLSTGEAAPTMAYLDYLKQLPSKQYLKKMVVLSGENDSLHRPHYIAGKALHSGQQHKKYLNE